MKAALAREEKTERGGRGEAPWVAEGHAWRTVRVGDLCDLVNGDPFKPTDWSKTGTRIIRIQNLNDASKPFNHWAGPVDRLVQVKDGDVLLAWSGTPGTSFGAHIWRRGDGVLNQHIFRVDITSDEVTPDWFVRAVNFCLQALISRAHGAVGLAHVTKGEVQALEIPLPPLAEQEQIAGRLTEQLGAVERARAAAAHRLAAAESLPAALLREVFEGPEDKTARLDDIAEIQLGKMAHPKSRQGVAPFPYLRNANVQWGRFDLRDVTQMDFNERERSKFALRPGDLIVCEGGEPGRAAVWEGQIADCYYQKALFRIRPFEDVADSRFLMYRLWFGGITGEFVESNAVTTISHLPRVRLCQLELTVPDLPTQRRLAAELSEKLDAAESAIARCREELAAIEALPAALLREAFGGNGELEVSHG